MARHDNRDILYCVTIPHFSGDTQYIAAGGKLEHALAVCSSAVLKHGKATIEMECLCKPCQEKIRKRSKGKRNGRKPTSPDTTQ